MIKKLLLISSFFFSTLSFACIGPPAEYYVLIEGALPTAASDEAVVAKVVLIDDKNNSGTVRVIEAIKGVQVGDYLEIKIGSPSGVITSCSRLKRWVRYPEFQDPGSEKYYYIAGNFGNVAGKQVFFGEWRDGKKWEYSRR